VHAAAVAYEVDLWPKWVPLCSQAEVQPLTMLPPLRMPYPVGSAGLA